MGIRHLLVATIACGSLSASAAVLKVVDTEGKAIAGASVLIGQGVDQPFAGNKLTTDANGQITTPAAWNQALPVTIEGTDLVRATHLEVQPNVGQLTVTHADGDQKIEISGTFSDFGQIKTDGKIDVGGFIPAIPRNQLLYFDVGWLVSPEYDTLKILGKELNIPSNIVLPKQQESYIFPITLDKPGFRMYVRKPGRYSFLAVHGQFPLKRVVDDFRAGAPVYDILNHGTLIQSGMVDMNITGNASGVTVPVNRAIFSNTMSVQAPTLAADDVVLTVALTETDSGALLPSDVKRLRSNQVQEMKTPASKSAPTALSLWFKERSHMISPMGFQDHQITAEDMLDIPANLLYDLFREEGSVLAKESKVDYKQVSFALNTKPGVAPKFISHVARPSVSGTEVKLTPPTAAPEIKPVATMVIYSSIKMVGRGETQTEQRTRLWEVWTSGWASNIVLPNLPLESKTGADKFRWEVLYLGQDGSEITHVSRNAVDL